MTPLPIRSVAAVAAALAVLTSCSTEPSPDMVLPAVASGRPTASLPPVEVETGLIHVHGLGVDPGDGTLYAATHSGLFRVPEKGRAERVANRAQDTMGFAVTGPGTFIGSGHPDLREDGIIPPLLGLVESGDAGETWARLSLHGEADFHALTAAHGRVYGYDATSGTFMVSSDRRTWDRRSQLELRDFAVNPADPDRVIGTGEDGTIISADGGRTWSPLSSAPPLVVLAWNERAGVFGVDAAGRIHRSTDDGASWAPEGSVGGPPEAITVTAKGDTAAGDAVSVYVAVAGTGILASADSGATFTVRYDEG